MNDIDQMFNFIVVSCIVLYDVENGFFVILHDVSQYNKSSKQVQKDNS